MHIPAPHPSTAPASPVDPPLRRPAFPWSLPASQPCAGGGESLSPSATRPLPRTPAVATTCDQRDPPCVGLARSLVRLASGPHCRPTQDLSPLASPRISSVLALEVSAGAPPDSCGLASAHP